jgi:hypothetical protein
MPIPASVLILLIAGGWLISLVTAFVGGTRGATHERLMHPVGLTGSVISLGCTLVATFQVSMLPTVSGWGDFGVWVGGLIVGGLAAGTPFMAYESGVTRRRMNEEAAERHKQSMTELRKHHAALNGTVA